MQYLVLRLSPNLTKPLELNNIQSKALHIEEMETFIVQVASFKTVESQKIYKTHISFKSIT